MKHRNERCLDIFKLKNVYIYKTSELTQTETKWLVARQAMQSANCVLARRASWDEEIANK